MVGGTGRIITMAPVTPAGVVELCGCGSSCVSLCCVYAVYSHIDMCLYCMWQDIQYTITMCVQCIIHPIHAPHNIPPSHLWCTPLLTLGAHGSEGYSTWFVILSVWTHYSGSTRD